MKKLLLHSCCAVCTAGALHILKNKNTEYEITLYFYNDNIDSFEEFERRLPLSTYETQFPFLVPLIIEDYSPSEFITVAKGFKNEKEGGECCKECFEMRLRKTAKKAKELGFDYFSTTLTISPHKCSKTIFDIGKKTEMRQEDVRSDTIPQFLKLDFKKNDGFKKAVELSKEFGLYRQNYCGCSFSRKK